MCVIKNQTKTPSENKNFCVRRRKHIKHSHKHQSRKHAHQQTRPHSLSDSPPYKCSLQILNIQKDMEQINLAIPTKNRYSVFVDYIINKLENEKQITAIPTNKTCPANLQAILLWHLKKTQPYKPLHLSSTIFTAMWTTLQQCFPSKIHLR